MVSRKNPKLGCLSDTTTDFSAFLDVETGELLAQIARVASNASIKIFLVGGIVRDMVSSGGLVSASPDLTVVGDATDFARRLAAEIEDCVLLSTSQHHTAEVVIGGTTVDIASARTDTYDPPGSLPQITLVGDITADLLRRDYTINAMALPISPNGLGNLIDPFDGRTDATNQTLRVLGERSFIEDPLRILRGIRLAARYQFDFEPRTAKLMSASLDQLRLMSLRSPQRVFNEFRLWFDPKEKLANLVLLANDTGLLESLGIPIVEGIDALRKLGDHANELERFAAFAYRLDPENLDTLVDRLEMPSEWRSVTRQVNVTRQVAKRCAAGSVGDLALRKSLIGIRDEVRQAVIATETNAKIVEQFNRFHHQIQHVRPDLNGDDLIELGVPEGPWVGELLNELLELRIELAISNIQEEREHIIRRLSDG
ncbi:MAG: CCA tRNA nucleotidyltransferase [Chloroflexi bacterium]|nr:CCA tRNA nucleotidyltransferase [Chloroflexota bacterium]